MSVQDQGGNASAYTTRADAVEAMRSAVYRFMRNAGDVRGVDETAFVAHHMPRGFPYGEMTWERLSQVACEDGFAVEHNRVRGRVTIRKGSHPAVVQPTLPQQPSVEDIADEAIRIQSLLKKHCGLTLGEPEAVGLAEVTLAASRSQPLDILTLTRLTQIHVAEAKEQGMSVPDFLVTFETFRQRHGLRESQAATLNEARR